MSTSADGEKSRWAQVMDNFNLHFTWMNDIGVIQQELKQHMTNNTLKVDQCTTDQQFIAQQIKANGQAVAQLTMRQSEHEASSISEGFVIADEDIMFENVFANCKHKTKPEPSHQYRTTSKERILTSPHPTQNAFPSFWWYSTQNLAGQVQQLLIHIFHSWLSVGGSSHYAVRRECYKTVVDL